DDTWPTWSPDGGKIIFSSNRAGDIDLWIMNADGTNPVRLLNFSGPDVKSKWSPDGSAIVFEHGGMIWRLNLVYSNGAYSADPAGPIRIATSSSNAFSWSPDGSQIAFQTAPSSSWDIYKMDRSGNNPFPLATS